MESLFSYVASPSTCGYLPEQLWSLEYDYVRELNAEEYQTLMLTGWRRFGRMLFRPHCRACSACRSLRVSVSNFRPDRSQRRAWKANVGEVRLRIGRPMVNRARLQLYDRYHAYQATHKGWPLHPAKDADSYAESFVHNPFPIQEWCYYLDNQLLGVGYVDELPAGLSAIYFFYDPDQRARSLGTFNVLSLINYAREHKLPHIYLGYYVPGCASMEYKPRFRPNQVLGVDGAWHDFLT